jgi:hypothetical protein
MGFAEGLGHKRLQTGPKDQAMREARICYNHLAGERGVWMFDQLLLRKHIVADGEAMVVTSAGIKFFSNFGIEIEQFKSSRRPMCRCCLDWSERRNHLAGPIAEAMLTKMTNSKWLKRDGTSRALLFTSVSRKKFDEMFL